MRIPVPPKRLDRILLKLKIIEYAPLCEYPDTKCWMDCRQAPELTPLEEIMACLDRTNEAIDRYLKEIDL